MAINAENKHQAFQLKGSLFTITVLQLFNSDETEFKDQLDLTISQAPKFFENAPIVIDLNEFDGSKMTLNFEAIIQMMRTAKLIPFGIRGGDLDVQRQAIANGLAILHNSPNANHVLKPASKKMENRKPAAESKKAATDETESKKEAPIASAHAKVITQPVRSGQQIYAKNADLIILSSVSHGAEILADGHIHVYGPLRGRALAGIMGNTEARIFCRSLDAELISVAGRYLVSEQLETYKDQQDLQIYLEEEQIKVSKLA